MFVFYTSRSSGSSRLAAGKGQRLGVSAPAKDPPPPTTHTQLPPSPAHARSLTPHRHRRKRAHLERGRGPAGAGARRAASLAAAAGRGVAGKAPFSRVGWACSPAAPQPLSACLLPPPGALRAAAGRTQPGLPARAPAWRGTARPAAGLFGRGKAGARTPARRRRGARASGQGAE